MGQQPDGLHASGSSATRIGNINEEHAILTHKLKSYSMKTPYILVHYYSRSGATAAMAWAIAQGLESIGGIEAKIRTVPSVSPDHRATASSIHEAGAVYSNLDELKHCAGLILGSPTRF